MASVPSFAELEKMTAAQQDAFFTRYLATLKGTVTAQWVSAEPSLAPYEGDTALQMYDALKTGFPSATPLQRGSTVYQAWLENGIGSTVQKIVGAAGTALGATATGVETASYVPSWAAGLTGLLANLTSANLWIRVGEIAVGLILLAVGLARLTDAVPVATQIAKTAGAAAV
jgi:hypothetical protein